jgi:hypothetical protein
MQEAEMNRHGHICTDGLSDAIHTKLSTILDKRVHTGDICEQL